MQQPRESMLQKHISQMYEICIDAIFVNEILLT